MKKINIHEAKTRLSAVLAEIAETGESYLICRNGKPVADLIPHVKKSRLTPHSIWSRVGINYDVTEPLSAQEWPEEI